MKKATLLCLLCLSLGVYSAWASTGSTNPNDFQDPVDWCTNFGCGNIQQLGTPQAWTSNGGATGMVGLISSQNMEGRQQPGSWNGDFPTGMGVRYNGVTTLGNTPGGILATFNQAEFGVGAWIQPDEIGTFTATISLLDSSLNVIGTFTQSANSTNNAGTGLFLGAYDSTADVFGILFETTFPGHNDDFAIGEMRLGHPQTTVPEPSSLLLMGSSVLGLAGVLRRRMSRKEVL